MELDKLKQEISSINNLIATLKTKLKEPHIIDERKMHLLTQIILLRRKSAEIQKELLVKRKEEN